MQSNLEQNIAADQVMEEDNESENIDCFKILKKCIVACRENYENKVRVTLQKLLNFDL